KTVNETARKCNPPREYKDKSMTVMINEARSLQIEENLFEPLPSLSAAERVVALRRLLGDAACRQLGIYPIPVGFKLSVVIPAYNEERWIQEVIRRVQAVEIPKEIIIVDDCSKDGTRDILRRLTDDNVRVF